MDDRMTALLAKAAVHPDGMLPLSAVQASDLPAVTRLVDAGLFVAFRELPRPHYALTAAGWRMARLVSS